MRCGSDDLVHWHGSIAHQGGAAFARSHLVNAPSLDIRMIPGRGHLIAFKEKDRITAAIREMVDTCMAKAQDPVRAGNAR